MLPGSAEASGRYVQLTSAPVPRNFAPSSKLTFDPSLTRLIATASAKATSRYEEPASWPDVFSPGGGAGGSTTPAPAGGAGSGQVTPSQPAVPSVPASPEPGGSSGGGGGAVWVPSPVILPPISSGGIATPAPATNDAPELPASSISPSSPGSLPIPDSPVVISTPAAPVPVDGRVADGGPTLLMLGAPLVLFAALRKRRPQW